MSPCPCLLNLLTHYSGGISRFCPLIASKDCEFFFIVKKCRNVNPYTNIVHFIVEICQKLGDSFMYNIRFLQNVKDILPHIY